jgi:hypothetical protein
MAERRKSMTDEEIQAEIEQLKAKQTEEQGAVMESFDNSGLVMGKFGHRDMPEGTVCTDPYYTDYPVLVVMK